MSQHWNRAMHNIYVFMVNGQPYGIDIAWIREIKELGSPDAITPVPHTPEGVLGYINVRGDIHQVLSLRYLLGNAPETIRAEGLIIHFKEKAGTAYGAYAESIREIIAVDETDIDRWENERSVRSSSLFEYVTCGVCRNGDEVIHLLSPERLFAAAAMPCGV